MDVNALVFGTFDDGVEFVDNTASGVEVIGVDGGVGGGERKAAPETEEGNEASEELHFQMRRKV